MQPEMPSERIIKMEAPLSQPQHNLALRRHLVRLAAPIHHLGHRQVAATLRHGRRPAAIRPPDHLPVAIHRPSQPPAAVHPLKHPNRRRLAMAIVRRPKSSGQKLIKGPRPQI
jgi:hypothetical protein